MFWAFGAVPTGCWNYQPYVKVAPTPRIAWDGGVGELDVVKEAVRVLEAAGYRPKDVQCFIIGNWKQPYEVVVYRNNKVLL